MDSRNVLDHPSFLTQWDLLETFGDASQLTPPGIVDSLTAPSSVWGDDYYFSSMYISSPHNTSQHTASPQAQSPASDRAAEEAHQQQEEKVMAVSSTFFPGWDSLQTDVVFSSLDRVRFYLHSQTLRQASPNAFHSLLSQGGMRNNSLLSPVDDPLEDGAINIPESSQVLNVVIHAVYNLSPAQYSPTYEVMQDAVNCMPIYGLVPKTLIKPGNPLYDLLLGTAPLTTINLYSLAAHHDIHVLAMNASPHLLSFDLSRITDELAEFMGAIYLSRLMTLHLNRVNSLKAILLPAPYPHPPTEECGYTEQNSLSRAWAFVSSYLAWDARPDLSVYRLQSTFASLGTQLSCDTCNKALQGRLKEVVVKWASVKRTI